MKLKSILVVSVVFLILALGMSGIYAEESTAGTSTFTVPDTYTANQMTENATMLVSDTYANVIYVVECDEQTIDTGKQNLLSKGYDLVDEETYTTSNGIEINQQNYQKGEYISCLYSFKLNNKYYVITYTMPVGYLIPEGTENPVSVIISTLK